MDYVILHDTPGRLRVRCIDVRLSRKNADAIGELLITQEGIHAASLSLRTGSLLITYTRIMPKRNLLATLDVLEPSDWEGFGSGVRRLPPSLLEMTVTAVAKAAAASLLRLIFIPAPVRYAIVVVKAFPIIVRGLKSLLLGRLDMAVLDAVALAILALRRDFSAIRTILYMFKAADALESWSREQSRSSLAESLALKVDSVWVRTSRGEVKRALADVHPGDEVVIRTGSVIPVDGVVVEGDALVNQSVLTGESEAAHKTSGLSVFAGTVIDEGTLVIRVEKAADQTRLSGINKFIEDSEALKAGIQSKAERLADAIVPYSLFLSFVVLLVTRSPVRAAAVLMVDYSCAIRMSTPLTILAAIQEGIRNGVLIKGGKYIEALAMADSLVIDKTGTLTMSRPSVARVVAFGEWNAREVLRTAACIEEHFPHPVARAVVKKAESENLHHHERHAEPRYILAHGVVSCLDGGEVLIGSAHFVFDDMNVPLEPEVRVEADREADLGRSLLYMAYDRRVVGILSIEDPIRDDAAETLSGLAENGVERIHMLTGDGERTARAVADRLGLEHFRANLLPVDKADMIREFRHAGYKVMFVGDGVNDSPALSAADVGVSLKDGADIAKEVAGVVLVDGKLSGLMISRLLSVATLDRINWQFGFIMALNSVLIALGLAGTISPRLAAVLHNLGTVAVTANSIRGGLLPPPDPGEAVIDMPQQAVDVEATLEEDGDSADDDVRFA